ncbi:MAG TPA: class I SAM-dependent methyltransferase [Angustibacter sp.]|nr:class I SAM-dependent methyltransferase [Angustibacter sp.]
MTFDVHASYDQLNAGDHDHRFYAALAQERAARRVLDLGCGTGGLACLLARNGHEVIAVDPDPGMLHVARARPGAAHVDWRLGTSDSVLTAGADLAVMTGHVAQVFVDDDAWCTTLRHLHQALVPGGTLAFETRNPAARGWQAWTREETLQTVSTPEGPVEVWHEVVDVDLPRVAYDTLTRNLATGEQTTTREVLAFRGREALRATVREAGYAVVDEFGDWSRSPVTPSSPELIVIAHRA